MSLTKCTAGTIQKFPFAANTAIELKNVPNTSDNTGTMDSFWIVPLFSSVSYVMYGKQTRIWCSAVGNTGQMLTTSRDPGTLMHIQKDDDVWRTDVRCPLFC